MSFRAFRSTSQDDSHALRLLGSSSGLPNGQQKEMAFIVYTAICGKMCYEDLSLCIRQQLEVTEGQASQLLHILSVVTPDGSLGDAYAASLHLPLQFLQVARPANFHSFSSFIRWQSTTRAVLVQGLLIAGAMNGHAGGSLRRHTARLNASSRWLDVQSPEQFEESVYQEGLTMLVQAVSEVASLVSTGWRLPWQMRVAVAEQLTSSLFDPEGNHLRPEAPALQELLLLHVWPVLGINQHDQKALYAWAHFCQAVWGGPVALLQVARATLQELHDNRPLTQGVASHEPSVSSEVALRIADWICEKLSTCYSTYPPPATVLREELEMLAVARRVQGVSSIQLDLERLIPSATAAALQMQLTEGRATQEPRDASQMLHLLAAAQRLLDTFSNAYAPVFAPHLPHALAVTAATVQAVLGPIITQWLDAGPSLEGTNLEAIRAAYAMEQRLEAAAGSTVPLVSPHPQPWRVAERMVPLARAWVAGQLQSLIDWSDRIEESEDWRPVQAPRSCARSAVEVVRIAFELLTAFAALRVPLPYELVRHCTDGVDAVIQKYAQYVERQAGDANDLVPPLPPVTRFKRELAVRAEQADSSPHSGYHGRSGNVSGESNSSTPSAVEAGPPRLATSHLLVLANSLHYVLEQIRDLAAPLQHMMERRDEGGQGRDPFAGARRCTQHALSAIVKYIATKVVFCDSRAEMEAVYRHSVERARLQPFLVALDAHLGDLAGGADDALVPLLAAGLLEAAVAAMSRILLDGGPYRWFIVQDVELIEEDVEQLRLLFLAEGDGLPSDQVTQACGPLTSILTVMQLETGILISNYQQVRTGPLGQKLQREVAALDSEVILRVLAHRADHAASKFLKSELNIPKAGAKPSPFQMPMFTKKTHNLPLKPEASKGSAISLSRFKQKLKNGTSAFKAVATSGGLL